MPDPIVIEQVAPAAPAVPAPVATPSPSVSATPEAVSSPQPDPVDAATAAPVEVASPPSAAAGAEVTPPAPERELSLLETIDAKPDAEAKPVEVKPAEAAKPEGEVKPAEAEAKPAELPKIDYFAAEGGIKLPDNLQMDDAQRGEFATALDAFRADPNKGAQGVIDMGVKTLTTAMTAFAEKMSTDQWNTFAETRRDWRNKVMADPEIGGSRFETAKADIADTRNHLISSAPKDSDKYKADKAEYEAMLKATGVGDHPAMLRLLHNASKFVSEAKPLATTDIKPATDRGRPADASARRARLYNNTQQP